jgi:hypothetical protein
LRGLIGAPAAPSGENSNVESFFQIPSGLNPSSPDKESARHSQAFATERKPFDNSAGRFLWHLLDNVGIPVPIGSHDQALDPSIRRNYVNPPLPDPDKYRNSANRNTVANDSMPSQIPSSAVGPGDSTRVPAISIQQKIPTSELEGTDLSTKSDDRK